MSDYTEYSLSDASIGLPVGYNKEKAYRWGFPNDISRMSPLYELAKIGEHIGEEIITAELVMLSEFEKGWLRLIQSMEAKGNDLRCKRFFHICNLTALFQEELVFRP